MSDPTQLAIIATFSAALVIFSIAAVARKFLGKTEETLAPLAEGDLENTGVPTWFYGRLDLLGLGLVFGVFFGLVVLQLNVEEKLEITAGGLLASIALQCFIALGVMAFVIRRVRPIGWLGLKWQQWPWVFLIAPGMVFGMWVLFGAMHFSGYTEWLKTLGVDAAQESVKLLQESKDPLILGLMALAAVVVAPVCEEVVFRGYFYAAGKKFAGPWCAGLCSALVFSAAHGNAMALLPIFVLGCALAFVYEKTGSLWAPIAVHFCFNGATVLLQFALRFLHLPVDINS